ncbi:hypothetical protein [Secundilactobacillus collinoides]|nr:hypothetical protein [Secundilactobacillus collinoides]
MQNTFQQYKIQARSKKIKVNQTHNSELGICASIVETTTVCLRIVA